MSVDGFSDTGLMVFVITMLVVSGVLVLAVLGTALLGGRHRFLKACGVLLGGAVLGTPVLIIATAVAMYI